MRRLLLAMAVLSGVLAVVGVGSADPAAAAPAVLVAARLTYQPGEVYVPQGTPLTFVNTDADLHDVTSTEGLFHSATISTGSTTVVGVEDLPPNTYTYNCTVHTGMKGLITVVGPSTGVPGTALPDASEPPVTTSLGVGVATPTSIAFSPAGDALYATSYALGAVYRMPVLPGGLLGPASSYATGFDSPLGVTVDGDGTLFVSDSTPSTTPGRTREGRVWAVPPGPGPPSIVVSGLPNGRHSTNNLALHGDRLYITNGSSTDDGVAGGDPEVPPWSGALLSVPKTARGLGVADTRVEARGMRNVYDVAFRPGAAVGGGEAWLPMNGPDAMAPLGQDLLLRATVWDGVDPAWTAADFGFPGCVYSTGADGSPQVAQNPAVAATTPCSPSAAPPVELLGLHPSADGLAFGPSDSYWHGDLFIAEFGSFNDSAGHKIVRVPIDSAGNAGPAVDFFVGDSPLDLAFDPAGTGLYVADFATGQITLLRPPP